VPHVVLEARRESRGCGAPQRRHHGGCRRSTGARHPDDLILLPYISHISTLVSEISGACLMTSSKGDWLLKRTLMSRAKVDEQ
jgi:hypothetical protein